MSVFFVSVFHPGANSSQYGEYKAAAPDGALNSYAVEAGYKNYGEVVAQFGDDAVVKKIDVARLVEAVESKSGKVVEEDSCGNGVAAYNNVVYRTYIELAESIGRDISDFAE